MLLRQSVTATSDGNGSATFVFPSVPINASWTGSFAVPSALGSSIFVLTLETGQHGGWGGPTPWGPLRMGPSEQATITATGLAPTTQYRAVLIGDQESAAQVSSPYPSPMTGQTGLQPAGVVGVSSSSAAGVTTVLAGQPGKTLIISAIELQPGISSSLGYVTAQTTAGNIILLAYSGTTPVPATTISFPSGFALAVGGSLNMNVGTGTQTQVAHCSAVGSFL